MTVLKKVVKKPMDAHLMVKHPQDILRHVLQPEQLISLRTQIALKVMLL